MISYRVEEIKTEEPSEKKNTWRRKKWGDMSPAQRSTNIVLAVVELLLTGLALWDIRHRPAEQINGKKRIWAMASLIQPFGPVVYFVFGRKREIAWPSTRDIGTQAVP